MEMVTSAFFIHSCMPAWKLPVIIMWMMCGHWFHWFLVGNGGEHWAIKIKQEIKNTTWAWHVYRVRTCKPIENMRARVLQQAYAQADAMRAGACKSHRDAGIHKHKSVHTDAAHGKLPCFWFEHKPAHHLKPASDCSCWSCTLRDWMWCDLPGFAAWHDVMVICKHQMLWQRVFRPLVCQFELWIAFNTLSWQLPFAEPQDTVSIVSGVLV